MNHSKSPQSRQAMATPKSAVVYTTLTDVIGRCGADRRSAAPGHRHRWRASHLRRAVRAAARAAQLLLHCPWPSAHRPHRSRNAAPIVRKFVARRPADGSATPFPTPTKPPDEIRKWQKPAPPPRFLTRTGTSWSHNMAYGIEAAHHWGSGRGGSSVSAAMAGLGETATRSLSMSFDLAEPY